MTACDFLAIFHFYYVAVHFYYVAVQSNHLPSIIPQIKDSPLDAVQSSPDKSYLSDSSLLKDTSLISDTSLPLSPSIHSSSPHYSPSSSSSSSSPPHSYYDPADNYDIAELESGDETDEEDCPLLEVPVWVSDIRAFLGHQFRNMSHKEIFGPYPSPDLDVLFQTKRSKFKNRTSSAVWSSAPVNQASENDTDCSALEFSTLTIDELSEWNIICIYIIVFIWFIQLYC